MHLGAWLLLHYCNWSVSLAELNHHPSSGSLAIGGFTGDATKLPVSRELLVAGDATFGVPGRKSNLYLHGDLRATGSIATRDALTIRDAAGAERAKFAGVQRGGKTDVVISMSQDDGTVMNTTLSGDGGIVSRSSTSLFCAPLLPPLLPSSESDH